MQTRGEVAIAACLAFDAWLQSRHANAPEEKTALLYMKFVNLVEQCKVMADDN